MNFLNSCDMNVDSAYIISLKDNKISEKLTKRCIESCENVNQPYKIFYGFDGTSGIVKEPEELKNQAFINFLRLHHSELTSKQIGCFLSHYSLWCLCLVIDRPIVILEHDAIMVKQYLFHNYYNNIVYLGSREQYIGGYHINNIPLHGSTHNRLNRFICRAHAYAIDPAIAKNLVSYVIRQGIADSLDAIIRADIFPIVQDGIYAYDDNLGLSTISQ
jgi:hypothetical protein